MDAAKLKELESLLFDADETKQEEVYVSNLTKFIGPEGCNITIRLTNPRQVGYKISFPDCTSWNIPKLGVEKCAFAHTGFYGSIAELLEKMCKDVERVKSPEEDQVERDLFVAETRKLCNSQEKIKEPIDLMFRDASGLMMVEKESKHQNWVIRRPCERSWQEAGEIKAQPPTVPQDQRVTSPEGVASLIKAAKKVVLLSGAGISVESGIPPFRVNDRGSSEDDDSDADEEEKEEVSSEQSSTNGVAIKKSIWGTFDAAKMTLENFNEEEEAQAGWWAMKRSLWPKIHGAKPNPAHMLFAQVHQQGKLHGIVTQNIDSLHVGSGVPKDKVLELHGHMRGLICSDHKTPLNPWTIGDGDCDFRMDSEEEIWKLINDDPEKNPVPMCPKCGDGQRYPLRTETVMFGQPMPSNMVDDAETLIHDCDLLFVIGTSLIVRPASELPAIAAKKGTPIVMMNLHDTQYDDHSIGLVRDPAGAFLEKVSKLL